MKKGPFVREIRRFTMVEAFQRFGREKEVDFVDAYLCAYVKVKKAAQIVTFNVKDFNVDGVTVCQPSEC